jgi:hypothetical protein
MPLSRPVSPQDLIAGRRRAARLRAVLGWLRSRLAVFCLLSAVIGTAALAVAITRRAVPPLGVVWVVAAWAALALSIVRYRSRDPRRRRYCTAAVVVFVVATGLAGRVLSG